MGLTPRLVWSLILKATAEDHFDIITAQVQKPYEHWEELRWTSLQHNRGVEHVTNTLPTLKVVIALCGTFYLSSLAA